MERDDAKNYIKEKFLGKYVESITRKSKSGFYVCPLCHSGTGRNGSGAFRISDNGILWKCFSCGEGGDIFSLFQKVENENDFKFILEILAKKFNVTLDETPNKKTERQTPKNIQEESSLKNSEDFSEYYKVCQSRLERAEGQAARDYLEKRGISLETAKKAGIGFDNEADPANAPARLGEIIHPAPRLIFPLLKTAYASRSIDENTPKKYQKMNSKGGGIGLFQGNLLTSENLPDVKNIFVVEGVLDALSIMEAGGLAIALNSVSNVDIFLEELKKNRNNITFIVSLDNDEVGKKATEKLTEGLQRLNVDFIISDLSDPYKDVNEILVNEKELLLERINKAFFEVSAKPDIIKAYLNDQLKNEVKNLNKEISTGFFNFDDVTGGLYGGLYCLAAVSSLGKTTFALQMAEQIAESGQDVIFFSLEQTKLEIVSKIIARNVAKINPNSNLTALKIRQNNVSDYQEELEQTLGNIKENIGENLSIVQGSFNSDIKFIYDYVYKFVRRNNSHPVVFIDYLQILKPISNIPRLTTREIIDNTLQDLKKMSIEFNIPVLVISSVNRSNYLYPIDFESLKESGGIEYTCDVILGLQYNIISSETFIKEKNISKKRELIKLARTENPRFITLNCLKNRFGKSAFTLEFIYNPAQEKFKERFEYSL